MAHFKKRRRYSFPAEAALTFAEVRVAPGSFAVKLRSRRASLIPAECLHHISIIHFRSHNSFHKAIYREDKTTSSSSLASDSTSPARQGCFSRSDTLGHEREDSLMQKPGSANKSQDGYLPVAPVLTPNVGRPQEALLYWSWGEPTSPARMIKQAMAPTSEPRGPVIQTSTSDSNLVARRKLSVRRKPYSFGPYTVESFPPLLDRSSTSEWRRAPLVDLDDPLAGHTQAFQEKGNTCFAGAGAGIPRMPTFGIVVLARWKRALEGEG